jgi:hypothetical protein
MAFTVTRESRQYEPYLRVPVADPLDLNDEDEIVGRVDEEGG